MQVVVVSLVRTHMALGWSLRDTLHVWGPWPSPPGLVAVIVLGRGGRSWLLNRLLHTTIPHSVFF
jgi:hypothetical protein